MHPISCFLFEALGFWDANLSWSCFKFLALSIWDSFPLPTHNLYFQGGTENRCYMCSLGDYSGSTLFYLGDMFTDDLQIFILHIHIQLIAGHLHPHVPQTSWTQNVSKSELISNVPLFPPPPPINEARSLGINFEFSPSHLTSSCLPRHLVISISEPLHVSCYCPTSGLQHALLGPLQFLHTRSPCCLC